MEGSDTRPEQKQLGHHSAPALQNKPPLLCHLHFSPRRCLMLGVSVELGTNLSLSGLARLQPPLVRLIVIMRSVMAAGWGGGRDTLRAIKLLMAAVTGVPVFIQIEGKHCQH